MWMLGFLEENVRLSNKIRCEKNEEFVVKSSLAMQKKVIEN